MFRLGAQFGERLSLDGKVLTEEVVHPLGQFSETADLLLDAGQGRGGEGVIRHRQTRGLQEGPGGGKQGRRLQRAQVLGVEPGALLHVEPGVGTVDIGRIKQRHQRCAVELFALGARGPAEQAEVVEDRVGQETGIDVALDRAALVALAHFRTAWVEDERDVGIHRRLQTEGVEQVDVFPGVRQMVLAADHMGDAHFGVVDDVDEVEDVAAVGAADRHVRLLGGRKGDIAADEVAHGDGRAAELEADGAILLGVGAPGRFQVRQVGVVDGFALALKVRPPIATHLRPLVPVEPQPAQAVKDRLACRLGVARLIGVLDAQDKLTTVTAGVEPVEQGGARPADVQVAGGGGSKTDADHGRKRCRGIDRPQPAGCRR